MKGEPIKKPRTPESFNVLVKELQSLGLSVNLLKLKAEEKEENEYVAVEEEPVSETKLEKDIHGKIEHEMVSTLPTKGRLEGFESEEEMKAEKEAEAKENEQQMKKAA